MRKRRRRDLRPTWDTLDDRCLPSGYTPAQIASAYGLTGIYLYVVLGNEGRGRWFGTDDCLDRDV